VASLAGDVATSGHPVDGFVRANLRWNVAALGADFGFFLVALSFASQSTILPAFAVHLGAPNVIVGAIPAVMTLGWLLPSVFVAGHTGSLPRTLPFLLRYTIWERLPFLALAAAAFVVADRAPGLALGLLLAALLLITAVGGMLMPAWMDLIGRAVPMAIRGRFFALSSTAGAIGGLGGSVVTAWVLGAIAPPASFGVCFLLAALFMAISYAALVLVREPPGRAAGARTPLTVFLRGIPGLLRRDRNFSWFLTARALSVVGAMGSGFYTVYALEVHRAAPAQVGHFTAFFYAGQVVGTLAFGWLADRAGHRAVIAIGMAAIAAAAVLALGASGIDIFGAVFVLSGVHLAAHNVSSFTVLLEFAPTMEERPTYIGLGNSAIGPVAFAAPLAAGLLADVAGFRAVFALAACAGAGALAVLLARVREPRSLMSRAAD
jgi:MFS family permease